jgi:hypothetical protein
MVPAYGSRVLSACFLKREAIAERFVPFLHAWRASLSIAFCPSMKGTAFPEMAK